MFIAPRDAANQQRDAAKLKYPPIDRLQPRSSQRFEAKIENVTTKRNMIGRRQRKISHHVSNPYKKKSDE